MDMYIHIYVMYIVVSCVSHMTVLAARSAFFICLTLYFAFRQTASESCEGAVSASCLLEDATQEHDCVCRNTRPGNSANSTTWPNQSTVISEYFVEHFCMYSV